MSLLATINRGKASKPPRMMVYGGEGVGKSTFASTLPNPIFVQTEDGLSNIDTCSFPLARSLEDVKSQLDALLAEKHEFATVVVDSLDWLERLIWDDVCKRFGVANIEKADGGYGKGYTHALNGWRGVISQLGRLRDERGMIVCLLAHGKVEKVEDPVLGTYDRWSPRLHKLANAVVCEWVDAILYAYRRTLVQKDRDGNVTGVTAVGAGGGERRIKTVGGPACVAKARFDLTDEDGNAIEDLPLSWDALKVYIP